MSSNVVIYCDGACSGNPGPGGWGSIIIVGDHVTELGSGESATTNNRMEMSAVSDSLRYCVKNLTDSEVKQIQIFTDSVYVIRGITQWIFGWKKRGWKNAENEDVSNRDLWIELEAAVRDAKTKFNSEIKWSFVKGHSGIEGNERCDEIAVAFSKGYDISLYRGPAAGYRFDVSVLPPERDLPEMKKNTAAGPAKPAWYLSYINGVLTRHETWKQCEAVVKGRPAKFKKVTSAEEEAAVKKSWGLG